MKPSRTSGIVHRLVQIYGEEVLSRKHRRVQLLGKKCTPLFQETLLGCELFLGQKRLTCPDVTTAQYLALFAEVGLESVGIPYDITRTASLLPALEQLFTDLKEAVREEDRPLRDVYRQLRRRIAAAEKTL
jgi:hypothetical protein